MKEIIKNIIGTINARGQEVPDSVPLSVQLDLETEEPIEVRVAKMLNSERMKQALITNDIETVDESNDFDVNGEDEIITAYETVMLIDEEPLAVEKPEIANETPQEITLEVKEEPTPSDEEEIN
jgi:hypothetical protein